MEPVEALLGAPPVRAGITVTPTSGLRTTEKGGTDSFTVVLDKQPRADVTIRLSTSDATEGMMSPATLTFTPNDWHVPQTVTVTGVDDLERDGGVYYTIVTKPAISADLEYQGLDAANVVVINADDEWGGLGRLFGVAFGSGIHEIDPITGAVVRTFPAPAYIGIDAGLAFDGKSLWYLGGSFNDNTLYQLDPDNGEVIRTYALPDNDSRDGLAALNGLIYITHSSIFEQDIVAFDPDTGRMVQTLDINGMNPGIFLSGGLGALTQPDALLVTGATDGMIHRINPATGVEIGSSLYVGGALGLAGWGNEIYVGKHASRDITVYTRDGREVRTLRVPGVLGFQALGGGILRPGIEVHHRFGLITTEAGGTASFTVALRTQPAANVTIPLRSSDTTEGVAWPASLTFTPESWHVPQTVVVTGVDDSGDDGSVSYTVFTAPAVSSDPDYSGLDAPDAYLTNLDDEVSGSRGRLFAASTAGDILEVDPASGAVRNTFAAPEDLLGGDGLAFDGVNLWFLGGTFAPDILYQLNPDTGAVIRTYPLPKNSSRGGLAALNGRIYMVYSGLGQDDIVAFDPANGTVVQTLDINGLNPGIDLAGGLGKLTDPDILVANAQFRDLVYLIDPITGMVVGSIAQNQAFAVSAIAGWAGEIYLGGHAGNEIFVTDASGRQLRSFRIPGISSIQSLGGGALPSGITVDPTSQLITTERGGTAGFTVVLEAAPSADVTIPVSSSNPAEGTVSPSRIVFTPANWSIPQTLTVTGVDDDLDDGDARYSVILGLASSRDPNYDGFDPADVSVININDDVARIAIAPVSGLETTEAGGAVALSVVLEVRPTADVAVALSSSDAAEGAVWPASLVFTPADWNIPRVVTVTGVDDFKDDGDVVYTISASVAATTDAGYAAIGPTAVEVMNLDDDAAGVTATPVSGLVTTEAGGAAEFTLVLDSQPAAGVTVSVLSGNINEGAVSQSRVIFTPDDWNVPQTVTITGVDDGVDDGDVVYSIFLGPVFSDDPQYAGLDPADVSVTNVDDDAAGLAVAPVSGLVTTEAGGTARFTVVLTSQPVSDVVVAVASADTTEGSVAPAALLFTSANWNSPQTVTVTGVDDSADDGDVAYMIVVGPMTTSDASYAAVAPVEVLATNLDNDTAGITVTPTAGLVTTEAGGSATFIVMLDSQPTAGVVIAVSSSDSTECTVLPAKLTFAPENWNIPRTVTVTGLDDFLQDGDIPCTIVLSPAASNDPKYAGLDPADVAVTNLDNDTVGIRLMPLTSLVTTEAGGTARFAVTLSTQPATYVSIAISASDPGEGTVLPELLTFTGATWNIPQTVTVTGVDDPIDDGDAAYTIRIEVAASTDPDYAGLAPTGLSLTNTDDDIAAVLVAPTSGLVTTEAGGTATFTIVLGSQPAADVTIAVASSDTAEGNVWPAALTFNAANWKTPQTVTVTGVDDFIDDGDTAYKIVVGPVTSSDAKYAAIDPADVLATNTDDDTAGVTVRWQTSLQTTEAGGEATFTVVLDTQPAAPVTITVESSNTAEGASSPAMLTFTPQNWSTPQQVTVAGVDDDAADGDVVYLITVGPPTGDPAYAALAAEQFSLVNLDDEEEKDKEEDPVAVDLGLVDFRRMESLHPAAGPLWYRLETAHGGWLTIQSAMARASAELALELYASGDAVTRLAASSPADATPRIDYAAEEGQVYLVKVSGSASGVDLWLANLVHQAGSAVTVYGTSQNDDFRFDAGASRTITINGVVYKFDGGEGWDSVWLYDSAGDETLEAWPDHAVIFGAAIGAAGPYSVEVNGFEDMQAYATQGGADAAILHGSSGGDKLKSYEDFVRLRAKNSAYSLRAKKFASIVCDAGTGGSDAAVFEGADGDETFTYLGADNSARMQGKRRDHRAVGFASVIAQAGGGESDVAYFTDLPDSGTAVDDVFYFKSHKTELISAGINVSARAFDEVHATASQGGFDVARIYDTPQDEHFECEGDTARFYRKLGTQLDLIYEVIAFERVKVYGSGCKDTKDVRDHTFELFFTDFGT